MEPYVGEIRTFAYGVIPKGWLPCNGATLAINQNQALFALIGTYYGGNGTTTFQLPDLRGAAMMGLGSTIGGYTLGSKAGTETVALTAATTPLHNHMLQAQTAVAGFNLNVSPPDEILAQPVAGTDTVKAYINTATSLTPLEPNTMPVAGSGTPHNNMPPFLTLNICIATSGIFPPRN